MDKRLTFKPEIDLGHIVQIVSMAVLAAGVYYSLEGRVQINALEIKANKQHIAAIRDEMGAASRNILEVKSELRDEIQRQEVRVIQHVTEVKEDVRWLVRRSQAADPKIVD